jgi:radical SAM protein with 4Fe4S-binding SPASM domain
MQRSVLYRLFGYVPPPVSVAIDPANICQLRCPLCPTGAGRLHYPKGMMTPETFRAVLDRLPSVKRITLFNWGESFLNPRVCEMIRYAADRDVFVQVHSNFSFRKEDGFFKDLVRSGLNYLSVSIDGATQRTYEKFRVGGDLDLVLSNIEKLVAAKQALNSRTPAMDWKFNVSRFNAGEVGMARAAAARLGIGFVQTEVTVRDMPDVAFDHSLMERTATWVSTRPEHVHPPEPPRACDRLFTTLVVNPDGRVFPCCYVSDERNVFGNLLAESLDEIWNNDKYRYARSLFSNRSYRGPRPDIICLRCDWFPPRRRA